MQTLTLNNCFQRNSTLVENDFIDSHMIKANGEYVKVYLYLLRHLNDPTASLTLSGMADVFENTERDILRALKYWEKQELLSIVYDENNKITEISIGTADASKTEAYAPVLEMETAKPVLISAPVSVLPSAPPPVKKELKELTVKERRAFKQLLFIAEQYLGKTLTKTDVDTITYFYDELRFSADLIEYLIEHCVENNHKSMHYIKSVALAWADAHIETVEQARLSGSAYHKNSYSVLKTFGISGRGPASSELQYIKKWIEEYGFSLELVLEACNRTITSTHQPSFEYADSILKNWLEHQVHHITDIAKLDESHKKEKVRKAPVHIKAGSTNRFNNFSGRTYDIDSLEEQLLNSK